MKELSDKEMKALVKEIAFDSVFKERTQEDRDSESKLIEEIYNSFRWWSIRCEYGNDYNDTKTYQYNENKTYWKSTGMMTSNFSDSEKESILKRLAEINSEEQYQKELEAYSREDYKRWFNTEEEFEQEKQNILNDYNKRMSADKQPTSKEELLTQEFDAKGINRDEKGYPLQPNGEIDWEQTSIEKQRLWEKHNKHEGAVKGFKKDRNKQTHLTPPKKKRK